MYCDNELAFSPIMHGNNVNKTVSSFDKWLIAFILSSMTSSYCSKLSVRINMQIVGFVIPNLMSVIIAYLVQWLALKDDDANIDDAVYLGILIFGFIPYTLMFTHLWTDDYMVYPLERNVFIFPSYKAVFTPTFSLLNRRIIEITEELENIRLKDAESSSNMLMEQLKKIWQTIFPTQSKNGSEDQWKLKRKRNSYDKSTRWLNGQKVPMIYICTTLWHEEDFEMATLIRSAIKLIDYAKTRKEKAQASSTESDAYYDYYNLEMHIFFDNVFDVYEECDDQRPNPKWAGNARKWKILNQWVTQFFEQLENALQLFRHPTDTLKKGRIIITPYGGRMEYEIGQTPLVVHLKDADRVQKGKRWSQVMYLYYLIGWKIDACQKMEISGLVDKLEKDKCFILALDGDVDFDPPALDSVLNRMKRNDHVAACCGQIHPKGSGWLVAYQRFEYAVGHWLQKTAEHVLGCVLCSPGCFSVMRMSNLAYPNVMAMYKSLAKTPLQKLQFDQGEDRWLCTLLLTSGGRIEFEASSHCNTFAPEDLGTFYKQVCTSISFHKFSYGNISNVTSGFCVSIHSQCFIEIIDYSLVI